MDTLLIYAEPEKKDFLLQLLKEFSFVKIIENYYISDEDFYVNALQESEKDIENGKIISHKQIKNEILTWRK